MKMETETEFLAELEASEIYQNILKLIENNHPEQTWLGTSLRKCINLPCKWSKYVSPSTLMKNKIEAILRGQTFFLAIAPIKS